MSFYRYLDDGRSHSYPTRRSSDLGTVYILEFSYSSNCTGTGPTLANAATFSLVGPSGAPVQMPVIRSARSLTTICGKKTKTDGTSTDTSHVPADSDRRVRLNPGVP